MEALSASVVLAAYAEQLCDGRRVVVFGDSATATAEELVERGARTVHVYDPDPSRAAMSASQNRIKQISIAPLDDADLAVRDGAFDVAFIEDLSSFAPPEGLLRRVRKALSSRGTAIVASPNPDARITLLPRTSASRTASPLGYYELYDAVSAEFTEVRMLGQTPFVGYAVVDFAPDGEPDVSIDSGLVPGGAEEPEWFVALASRERVECDPVGIVQLPASKVTGSAVNGSLSEELRTARSSEAGLQGRVGELEVELSGLRDRTRDTDGIAHRAQLEAELLQRDATIADLRAQVTAADTGWRAQLTAADTDWRTQLTAVDTDLRAQLTAANARDARSKDELASLRRGAESGDAARAELAKLTPAQSRLEGEVASQRHHAEKLSAELASQKQHAEKLSAELASQKQHAEKLSAELASQKQHAEKLSAELASQKQHSVELGTRKQEVTELLSRVTVLSEKNVELTARAAELERDKAKVLARLEEQASEVAAQRQRLAGVETELGQLRADDETPRELAALEATLKERGEHIRGLTDQLREAERVGRELLRELGHVSGPGATTSATTLLAAENAQLTANLEALSWTVQELEGRLSTAPNPAR